MHLREFKHDWVQIFCDLNLDLFFYSICCASITYRHHFYNKGKGSARRFLIRQSLRPRTGQSRAYWPTSPSEELCLLPHPQVSYLGSSLVKVSECPCESPSDIEASLFVPCCRQRKKRHSDTNKRREVSGRRIREIILSPDCVSGCFASA